MRGLMGPYFLPELASVSLEFHLSTLNQYHPIHWLRKGLAQLPLGRQLHLAGATPVGEREPVFQHQQPLLVLLLDLTQCEGVWQRVQVS